MATRKPNFKKHQGYHLVIDVRRVGRVGDEPSHALDDLNVSFVDDDAAVGEDKVGDAVDNHALEDVEVYGVVVGLGRDGPVGGMKFQLFNVSVFQCFLFLCFNVSTFQCFNVSMFQCFNVSMFQCFNVSTFQHFNVSMFQCFDISTFQCFNEVLLAF